MKTFFRSTMLLLATAVAVSLAACGTGLGGGDSTSGAASAASAVSSHFNADLATAYETLAATRQIGNGLALAGKIDKAGARMVQSQVDALRGTLDTVRAAGASPTSQSTLTTTLIAIQALSTYVKATQGAPQ